MSEKRILIEERSPSISNFTIGRFLPFRKERMVGPFILVDHMGPATVSPQQIVDVD